MQHQEKPKEDHALDVPLVGLVTKRPQEYIGNLGIRMRL